MEPIVNFKARVLLLGMNPSTRLDSRHPFGLTEANIMSGIFDDGPAKYAHEIARLVFLLTGEMPAVCNLVDEPTTNGKITREDVRNSFQLDDVLSKCPMIDKVIVFGKDTFDLCDEKLYHSYCFQTYHPSFINRFTHGAGRDTLKANEIFKIVEFLDIGIDIDEVKDFIKGYSTC